MTDLAQTIWMTTSVWANQKRVASQSPTRLPNTFEIPKPRYRNDAIELELILFKKEIEEKFSTSVVNKTFVFPRMKDPKREKLLEEEDNMISAQRISLDGVSNP